jgi:hypothetical protein
MARTRCWTRSRSSTPPASRRSAPARTRRSRGPRPLRCGDLLLRLVAFSDHPGAYAAGAEQPGIAFAGLDTGLPDWVREAMRRGPDADAVLVTPHWGPNTVAVPVARVRRATDALVAAGATLVAGHSAHVFQGVAARVLFDLGDFLDDHSADSELRNDLGCCGSSSSLPTGRAASVRCRSRSTTASPAKRRGRRPTGCAGCARYALRSRPASSCPTA